MGVIRVNKTNKYTVMSNNHLRRNDLSLKAKGLLSVMLALPDNWQYTIAGLVAISKENETAIKTTLNELKEFGYLIVTKLMPNETKTGRIEYIYDIYEEPQQGQEKQDLENLGVEILGLENQGQLNTKNQCTEELNKQEGNRPTLKEVQVYAESRGRLDLAQKFYDYYTENDWVDSQGHKVGSWKQKFLTWCNKEDNVVFVTAQGQDVIHNRKYSKEEMDGLITDIDTIEI